MCRRRDRGQFPVRQMRGEAQGGFAVCPKLIEQRHAIGLYAAGIRVLHIEVPDPRHMDVFAGDAPQIVPGLQQRRLDPGRVLFGKGGA